jgi:hypothetical protein
VERITAWIKRFGQPTDGRVAPDEAAHRAFPQGRETDGTGQRSAADWTGAADTRQRAHAAPHRPQGAAWESDGGASAGGVPRSRAGERYGGGAAG